MKAAVNATLVPAPVEEAFGAPLDIVSILKRSAIVAPPEALAAPGVFTVIGFLIFMRKLYHLIRKEINGDVFLEFTHFLTSADSLQKNDKKNATSF